MSDHEKPYDAYGERIPPHECDNPEECPYPAGFFFCAVKDPDDPSPGAYLQLSGVHKIEPTMIVTAFISFLDQTFQANRGDMPPIVAFARARELVRQYADQLPPPGEVSAEVARFTTEDWEGIGHG